jgi:hypothetical protein
LNRLVPLRLRIYGRSPHAAAAIGGVETWDAPAGSAPAGGAPARTAGAPLRIPLETALARLEAYERMFVEPDGSFLWTGEATTLSLPEDARGQHQRWQLEGTIYDDGQVVRYIDVLGDCPLLAWQAFLAAFDESLASVTLELVEENLIVAGDWLQQRSAEKD